MGVSIVCGVVLALALAGTVRWRNVEFRSPDAPPTDTGRAGRARHYLWWVQLDVITGLTAGILVMGTGGRLAMRLLGATGGDRAQGRITEADEVVGEVTISGTLGFVLFIGIITGLLTAVLWYALRRFLPPRWVGGLAFGAGLLVVFGTRNDPLRPGNEDFDIVGPWWLAVVVFSALALVYGVALACYSARLSRWLPPFGQSWRSLSYVLLLILVPFFPLGMAALLGGAVYVFGPGLVDRGRALLTGPAGLRVARLALVAVVVIAAPGFVVAIGDLVGRGP